MVRRLGEVLSRFSARFIPDPLLFAVILTVIAFVLALGLTDSGPLDIVIAWESGFWNLLEFAMQMVLILVTGHALATAPGVHGLIERLAGVPKNTAQAAALTALVACVTGWVNWGLGLIVGALFALEVGRRAHALGRQVHYPLVVAAGYTSQMVWHWGPSSSAGLLMATEGHFLSDKVGVVPLTETVFSSYALINSAILIAFVPVVMYFMAPRQGVQGIAETAPRMLRSGSSGGGGKARGAGATETSGSGAAHRGGQQETATEAEQLTFADRLERSWILGALIVVLAGTFLVYFFVQNGFDLDLNVVNLFFLTVGLALHRTPLAYARAIRDAIPGASGIVLQFPFYGGIMGIVSNTALGGILAGGLVSVASTATFPMIAWLTAGFINLFVPSGGGEWAVIGPIITDAALKLDVPIGQAIIAYGAGDMWTNMFQPFWAIALLGITGLRARDIIGYTSALMILAAPVFALGLSFIPY